MRVHRRLRVACFFTGDELAMPGEPLRPGSIYNAKRFVLTALLRRRIGPTSLAVGGLVWLAVLAGVLAAYAPGGSYLAV